MWILFPAIIAFGFYFAVRQPGPKYHIGQKVSATDFQGRHPVTLQNGNPGFGEPYGRVMPEGVIVSRRLQNTGMGNGYWVYILHGLVHVTQRTIDLSPEFPLINFDVVRDNSYKEIEITPL